jgi:thiamine biosynthesis protein ThiI
MKMDRIICHYDEIALKGRNRKNYENKLIANITAMTAHLTCIERVARLHGRIAVVVNEETFSAEADAVYDVLKHVFGIAYFRPSYSSTYALDAIKNACLTLVRTLPGPTFRISAKRSDKTFPLNSQELEVEVGGHVFHNSNKAVQLVQPDINCTIEIVDGHVYISAERYEGLGGLPVGTSGKMLALMSGGFDSPVAAWYMMKRGVELELVHFHNHPYTSQASLDKVTELAQTMTRYHKRLRIHFVTFSDVQNNIARNCPEKLRIILYRRFMFRIAEKIANQVGAGALVTGEALSQVASQTIENIAAAQDVCTIPIMQPLIGFDKYEIMEKAREIGTYDISIRPHDDCCVRFMPTDPETRAKLDEVRAAESTLEIEELVHNALEKTEAKKVSFIHD